MICSYSQLQLGSIARALPVALAWLIATTTSAQSSKPDLLVGISDGTTQAFKNDGTCSAPSFQTNDSWDVPDIGSGASPAYADLDRDGDYDLMIGSNAGGVLAYQNVGTGKEPEWSAKPAWNVGNTGTISKAPTLKDLDNDGDLDMLVGNTNGISYGYRNNGTKASPTWALLPAWNSPDVGSNASPSLADLDGDGDFDLLVGHSTGATFAYRNTGSTSSPTWSRQAAWDPPTVSGGNASPAVIDFGCDGDQDLYIASSSGTAYAMANTGSSSSPTWSYTSGLDVTGIGADPQIVIVDLNDKSGYTHVSISSGAWTSGSTWNTGSAPSSSSMSSVVFLDRDVTLNSGLTITNFGSITVSEAKLTVSSGNIWLGQGNLAVYSGELHAPTGNLELTSAQSTVRLISSVIDIGQNLINTNGLLVLNNVCGSVQGQNFQNTLGTDSLVSVQLTIGGAGSGNFENAGGSTMYFSQVKLKVVGGNFTNAGTLSGTVHTIWVPNGNLDNGGTWTAAISKYCVGGSITVPPAYRPPSEDCADVASSFQNCDDFFLPVKLLSFEATPEEGRVIAEWTTLIELNTSHFVVERSSGDGGWEFVGSVAASGTSLMSNTYSIEDATPSEGNSYYRVVEHDFDGTSTVLAIDQVYLELVELKGTVTPNPSDGDMFIELVSPRNEMAVIHIENSIGQMVFETAIVLKANETSRLQLPNPLSHGMYFVTWTAGGHRGSTTVVAR